MAASSCSTLFTAVIVLSCINVLLIVVIVIFSVVAILYMFHRKPSTMDPLKAIYESPDDMKEESFHMTKSSVYGIHKAI